MASVRREQAYAGRRAGKAPSERPAFQPYRGKLAVRNDRGDRGNVGIIRSPVRASILPDRACAVLEGRTGKAGRRNLATPAPVKPAARSQQGEMNVGPRGAPGGGTT